MCVCVCVYIYIYTHSAARKFVNPLEFSIFLHKCDPKHIQIFAQVLKVDKENPIKQIRQKYFIVIYLFRKMIQYYISVNAKVCESLGLAVNLKVKLESICAEVFSVSAMTIKCQYVTCLFEEQDLSKSDHVCGSESCHEQRRSLRTSEKELMLLIRLEKVTKPSLKSLDSTNPQSDRLCTNGGNSRPTLPSREVIDQQRSLQSRTCNSLRGCKSSQGNF